jgi:CRISPR-associated protein Csa1
VSFINGRMSIKKEYFFISDELRSWWVEERDKKLEIVAQKKDPGIATKCPEDCIYWNECRGS